jgi:glycosyltransferase involved in cell wall biosynthesis
MSLYSLSVSALLVGLSATPGDADEFSQSAAARCRPDVSVVIAAHNAEAYIGETIESILAQEGVNCEILVMDDGSRDRTGEVVKSFGSKVTYHYAPPSGGPSKPRNLGVKMASGEFVAMFDADDVMLPGKLKAQIDALRAHPEIPCVVADYRNFTEAGPEPITHFDTCDVLRATMADGGELVVLPASSARDVLTQENFSITGSLVLRRTAMLELQGFDHRLCPAAEDFDLTYRCALSYPIGVLRQVGFNRRLHIDNASKDSSRVLRQKALTRRKLAGLETDPLLRSRLNGAASGFQLSLVVEHARHGRVLESGRAMFTVPAIRQILTHRGVHAVAWLVLGPAVRAWRGWWEATR